MVTSRLPLLALISGLNVFSKFLFKPRGTAPPSKKAVPTLERDLEALQAMVDFSLWFGVCRGLDQPP